MTCPRSPGWQVAADTRDQTLGFASHAALVGLSGNSQCAAGDAVAAASHCLSGVRRPRSPVRPPVPPARAEHTLRPSCPGAVWRRHASHKPRWFYCPCRTDWGHRHFSYCRWSLAKTHIFNIKNCFLENEKLPTRVADFRGPQEAPTSPHVFQERTPTKCPRPHTERPFLSKETP